MKRNRYGQIWNYNCPNCNMAEADAPQLNFKNSFCCGCGWNNFGMNPKVILDKMEGWE